MTQVILPFKKQSLKLAGRLPGFDPTHIAAVNARFSAIAVPGGGYLVLNSPTKQVTQTIGAATFNVDGTLGPCYTFTNSTQGFRYGNMPTILDATVMTMAATITPTSLPTTACIHATSTSSSSGWFLRYNNTGAILLTQANVNDITSTITLTASVPQLVIASAGASGKCNFLILRLDTGAIKTSTTTFATSALAPNGIYEIGEDPFLQGANGKVGHVMASATSLSIPQLVQWASNWSNYWYPQTLDLAMMITSVAGGAPSGPPGILGLASSEW